MLVHEGKRELSRKQLFSSVENFFFKSVHLRRSTGTVIREQFRVWVYFRNVGFGLSWTRRQKEEIFDSRQITFDDLNIINVKKRGYAVEIARNNEICLETTRHTEGLPRYYGGLIPQSSVRAKQISFRKFRGNIASPLGSLNRRKKKINEEPRGNVKKERKREREKRKNYRPTKRDNKKTTTPTTKGRKERKP